MGMGSPSMRTSRYERGRGPRGAEVEVRTHDQRRLPGAVVLYDEERDLALVQVEDLGLAPLVLARAEAG